MPVTHSPRKMHRRAFGACIVAAILGLGGVSVGFTQDASPPATARKPASESDAQLAARVKKALDTDPYFYAEHTTVSVEDGAVVLTGIVQNNRAIFDAIDIAKKAAPGRKIIDRLSITKVSPH